MVRVLLGDDLQLFLKTERSFLRRDGCEILTVATGGEALERIRSERPDLAVLDARMSSPDGVDCCRALKADATTRSIPILLVANPTDHEACAEAGADAVVDKPLTPERLLAAVHRFVPLDERADERVHLAVRVDYNGGSGTGFGYTRDLGPEGFFLKTRDPLAPGEILEAGFVLPLPGAKPIRAEVRVIHVLRPEPDPHLAVGVGVRFERLGAADRLEITRFLREKRGVEA